MLFNINGRVVVVEIVRDERRINEDKDLVGWSERGQSKWRGLPRQ